jgi:hypothetical protein
MSANVRESTAVGIVLIMLVGVLASAAGSSASSPRPPRWVLRGSYAPVIDPAKFVTTVDNRYFPLKPGTAFHFRGVRDSTAQTDDMVVTRQIKRVLGVRCTVVRDTVSEHGRPVERTFDWYAQDKQGNVWYMGEDSLELKNGRLVRASDSWQAGVNGAKPGVIMRGRPVAGAVYRQEYYRPGGALDQARVLGRTGSVQVPVGTFKRPLVTIEWSPVEPQLEKKYYVAGIGEVMEEVVAGGHEEFQLLRVSR